MNHGFMFMLLINWCAQKKNLFKEPLKLVHQKLFFETLGATQYKHKRVLPNLCHCPQPQKQKHTSLSLWPPPFIVYINESSTLGKAYVIKVRCYWEHLGEHIETFLGTPLEIDGNTLGTAQKNQNSNPYSQPLSYQTLHFIICQQSRF